MVGLVDDLEARGLVERRRHHGDRRAYALFLTDTARDLLTQADRAADTVEAEMLAPLSADDRDHLFALLRRVAAHAGLPAGIHPRLHSTTHSDPP
jgi:DNA-binding MarR family transcriptional regulator